MTDAYLHTWDNLHIRDRYLRAMLATEDPSSPHLGQALLTAEYYRRTREELLRVESGMHSSLNLVHVNLLNTMKALHQEVHELRGEVAALRQELQELEDKPTLGESLRNAAKAPTRAARRLLKRG